MLETIQKRPEHNMLRFEFTSVGGRIKVSETILMKNCDYFHIDEKIGENSEKDIDSDDSGYEAGDDDNSLKF